jgi:hypothetical protein
MSLLKRLLGIDSGGDDDESDSPTIARIAEALDGMPKERAHYIAAFAYVLARTAHADLRIEDSEVEAMNRATSATTKPNSRLKSLCRRRARKAAPRTTW